MSWIRGSARSRSALDGAALALGVAGGVTVGLVLSRILPRGPESLLDRIGDAARSLGARLPLLGDPERKQLDRLEHSLLNSFLADSVLSGRGVEIGAISLGIIELSGRVASQQEIERAVSLATRVPGVRSVVNRLEIEVLGGSPIRRRLAMDESGGTSLHQEGRVSGMGRRRQSLRTDPDRPDDSQKRRERALAAADRDQWTDEGLAGQTPKVDSRGDDRATERTNYAADELDNQDPRPRNRNPSTDEGPVDPLWTASRDRAAEGESGSEVARDR